MITLFCLYAAFRLHMQDKEATGWFLAAFIIGVWADGAMIQAIGEALK